MSATRVRFLVVTVALIALPGLVHARGRGYRSGPAMSVYGPIYNPTSSPEYRLWAGSPAAYERMVMMRQQQMVMRQQQMYMKQMKQQQQYFKNWVKTQKARKAKGLPTDPDYDQYLRIQAGSGPGFQSDNSSRGGASGDPTVAPGGGPRRPAARKAATKKSAASKGATKKSATKKAEGARSADEEAAD